MNRQARRPGFTLVELLAVVAIIALLIAILLPMLGKARKAALNVKCLTQLKEIGNSLFLYSVDNKGWWPVMQHDADSAFPPNNPQLQSTPARSDYWYEFLVKYFSKKPYTGTLVDFQNTPLWGCPGADKEDADASGSSAQFNSGYGFSVYALYEPDTFIGVNSGPATAQGYTLKSEHWAFIKRAGDYGEYFKQVQWKLPSQHGIVVDSRSWFPETRSVANEAAITAQTDGALGYNPSTTDQFDRYRHGDRRKMNVMPQYRKSTEGVKFNMLYCDGHAETLIDVKDGYKGFRMKFPN